jgi:uncharacterized tellurite resistance protein B-like protein
VGFHGNLLEIKMAEWRAVAKAFALGDGHIAQKEVTVLRQVLLADGHVSKSELDFLKEIKKEATSSVQLLDELIADCEKVIR